MLRGLCRWFRNGLHGVMTEAQSRLFCRKRWTGLDDHEGPFRIGDKRQYDGAPAGLVVLVWLSDSNGLIPCGLT